MVALRCFAYAISRKSVAHTHCRTNINQLLVICHWSPSYHHRSSFVQEVRKMACQCTGLDRVMGLAENIHLPAGHNWLVVFFKDFLALEGRGKQIQQVGTVLNHVKKHLPKAHVKELNSWIESQEIELEKMESMCQVRAKELDDYLHQLLR